MCITAPRPPGRSVRANLDDDDCDGKVHEKDIPEIVFSTFTGGAYHKQGTLHAISVVGGYANCG